MMSNKIIEKSEVRDYFNGTGFERWNKIYSKSDKLIQFRIILGKDIKRL